MRIFENTSTGVLWGLIWFIVISGCSQQEPEVTTGVTSEAKLYEIGLEVQAGATTRNAYFGDLHIHISEQTYLFPT